MRVLALRVKRTQRLNKQLNALDALAAAAPPLDSPCQSRSGKNALPKNCLAQKLPCPKIALPENRLARKAPCPKSTLPKNRLAQNRVAEVKCVCGIAGPEIAGNIKRSCLPFAARLIPQFVVDFENARVKKSFPGPATVVV